MCWCVSLLLCASAALLMLKSHSGMGHFVIKCSVAAQAQAVTLLCMSLLCIFVICMKVSLSNSLEYFM